MCQYSAVDGCATSWHLIHLGQLALSGAGLVMVEATAVSPAGRITHRDLGLYSDAAEQALAVVLRACRENSGASIGIQLAHSGRKGSARLPWQGGGPLGAEEDPWRAVAPSAIPYGEAWPAPEELTDGQIAEIKADYVNAALRAARLGIDLVELHVAHGYLLHAFLSPLANRRNGAYGGSAAKRMRLPLEIAAAVRSAWPAGKPMGARITGSDWLPGGLTVDDAVVFARELKALGLDYVCVSSAGIVPRTNLVAGPGYQVPFAARVRRDAGILTQAVGLITEPEQAEAILAAGAADMVALARSFLDDPRWPWRAARKLGVAPNCPPQYLRSQDQAWLDAGNKG